MKDDIFGFLVFVIVIQGFYGLSVTTLTYALPEQLGLVVSTSGNQTIGNNIATSVSDIEENFESQTNIPVIGQLGALVFYSGNILIDLVLNFLLALPQMFSILFTLFLYLFGLNTTIVSTVQLFLSSVMIAVYLLGLIQLILNIRSGQRVN